MHDMLAHSFMCFHVVSDTLISLPSQASDQSLPCPDLSSQLSFLPSSNQHLSISLPPFFRILLPMAESQQAKSPGGGGGGESGGDQSPRSSSSHVREQDRFLPIANISRIMKRGLPANGKIAKDAKEIVQECVSEFISFITSEASDKCQREKRKTINGDDLLWAMATLGFEDYIDPLKVYLTRYREMEGDTKGSAKGGDANAKRDGQSSQNGQFSQLAHQASFSQAPYGNSQGQHMMVPMPGTD
ncbi:Nuclear transcription factor Y subunit B-8 [Raphanus sativus]|nr:Nuclear transcription factor Y subunit B-8 [Raphanus sativus]